jgi:2,4-dienoyl-CoA reductase-like NADH-dependent reductase (Old Yellow Enzyme family)
MTYLDKPFSSKKIQLKNRLVMPPMYSAKADEDGSVNNTVLDFYDEKTSGGYISLVIIEHCNISLQGRARDKQISAADDKYLEGLEKLGSTIHKNGSKVILQINHGGSATTKEISGMEPTGPSPISTLTRDYKTIPRELSREEIKTIVNDFKNAALRVKKAGFDGVEVHSAHGYLLSQFLSPLTNKRTDEYGGGIEGRSRIHLEIISAVRDAIGEDFPLLLRLGVTDHMEGGLTFDEGKSVAVSAERAGADILDISGGMCAFTKLPNVNEPGFFSHFSKEIRESVSCPVLVAGGINKAEDAEMILSDKRADLVGVGRAILKDSGWAKAAMESLEQRQTV